jgi:hypothetical protein
MKELKKKFLLEGFIVRLKRLGQMKKPQVHSELGFINRRAVKSVTDTRTLFRAEPGVCFIPFCGFFSGYPKTAYATDIFVHGHHCDDSLMINDANICPQSIPTAHCKKKK